VLRIWGNTFSPPISDEDEGTPMVRISGSDEKVMLRTISEII
jgi:hypothetical protein